MPLATWEHDGGGAEMRDAVTLVQVAGVREAGRGRGPRAFLEKGCAVCGCAGVYYFTYRDQCAAVHQSGGPWCFEL